MPTVFFLSGTLFAKSLCLSVKQSQIIKYVKWYRRYTTRTDTLFLRMLSLLWFIFINTTTDKILKDFKIIFLYDWYKYDKIIGYYDKFRSVIKSEKNTVNQKNFYFIR